MKKHIPNILSVIRAGLSITLLSLLFIDHQLITAQIIFVTALVSDKLDGTLARLWNVESEIGKKLESVVDPLFSLASGAYIIVVLDFPLLAFWIAAGALAVVSVVRLTASMLAGKLFYEKSPITRYGVGMLYVVVLFYMMQWGGREYLVWPVVAYGLFAGGNYTRMLVRAILRSRGRANGDGQAQ